jgi:precorrin-6A/cobalt-precorrin-6A reductase
MHDPAGRQPARLWLIAGTGEGPRLARQLLERGWQLEVSVVTAAASLAYPAHRHLRLLVGALAGGEAIRQRLSMAAAAGQPYAAVVDASHPFARQISAQLAEALGQQKQQQLGQRQLGQRQLGQGQLAQGQLEDRPTGQLPARPLLLRLERPLLSNPRDRLLADLEALAPHRLAPHCLAGRRLLLAIGARQLGRAVALSPGALHHARLLPTAEALQRAMAAGIAPERLACLRPGGGGEAALLAALLRRWRIDVILCRQSGGITETLWRQLAASQGCELLLLRRPADPAGVTGLAEAELLARLEQLRQQLLAQPPGA